MEQHIERRLIRQSGCPGVDLWRNHCRARNATDADRLSRRLRNRDLEVRFVKRERSNPDKASLHLAICGELGNGEANLAVNPSRSPSADSNCRGQHRSCASCSLSVSSTHQAVFSFPRPVLDEARVLVLHTPRFLGAANLHPPGGGVKCPLVKSAHCNSGGGSRRFAVPSR